MQHCGRPINGTTNERIRKSCFAASSTTHLDISTEKKSVIMDSTIVSALAAVLGSLVGGAATIAATLVSQKTRSKHKMVQAEIKKRETLYGEFISECCKRAIDSFESSLDKPEVLLTMYELVNRIRLCSSDAVLEEAQQAVAVILDQYFSSNLSLEETRALLRKGLDADPLRRFAEACRFELKGLATAVQP